MSDIRIIRDFYSYPEKTVRTLRIYTPDACYAEPERHLPVLYMLDGQNVFSHPESALYHTWCANTTMDRLVREGRIPPWIVVAVDHLPDRFSEYSPWWEPAVESGGLGLLFVDFLVNHLKPFIDQHYRTLTEPHWTGVMGSSLGGLMSLVASRLHPDVFGRVGALSPVVMWAGGEIFRFWSTPTGRWCKIYMDAGSLEQYWLSHIYLDYVEATKDFYSHLKSLGMGDHELRHVIAENHFHNEEAWQARLPDIFQWLLEDAKGI